MKTLLHKPIVFTILLLLIGIFFTGAKVMGQGCGTWYVPSVTVTSDHARNAVCPGESMTFTATPHDIGGGEVKYEWYHNGDVVGSDQATYTSNSFKTSDRIECKITIVGGNCLATNVAYSAISVVYVISDQKPIITLHPDWMGIPCEGTDVRFYASVSNTGNGTVHYFWKINEVVVGPDDIFFNTSDLKNGDKVSCEIEITDGRCLPPGPYVSDPYTVVMQPQPRLGVQIYSDASNNSICLGDNVSFRANVTGTEGGEETYYWYVNNGIVGNQATFSSSSLINYDQVKLRLVVKAGACGNFEAYSNFIEMSVANNTPYVYVFSNDIDNIITAGTTVTFTANTRSTGNGIVSYFWKLNGSPAGSGLNTFTTSTLQNGDEVSCEIEVAGGRCMATTHGSSNIVKITVGSSTPDPGVLSGDQSTCIGSSTTFSSTVIGGTWSSSSEEVASVDANTGVITGHSLGTAIISYTVSGTGGAADGVATRSVTVYPVPNAGTIGGAGIICVGGTLDLFIIDGSDEGTWISSDRSVAIVDRSTGHVTGISEGSVEIVYTVPGAGSCSSSSVVNIDVASKPDAGDITGHKVVCIGNTIDLNSSGEQGGIWSSSDPGKATVDENGIVTGIGSGPVTIYYSVGRSGGMVAATIVPSGCPDDIASYDVNVFEFPNPGEISGSANICVTGGSALVTSGDFGGKWSSSDPEVAFVEEVSGYVTGIKAGTAQIIYTVTNNAGCSRNSEGFSVVVTAPPVPGIIIGSTALCGTNSAQLTVQGGEPGGIWYSNRPENISVTNSGYVTGISGNATISYVVFGSGGCGPSQTSLEISVIRPPFAGLIDGRKEICVGGSTELVLLRSDAGGTWNSLDPTVATVSSEGIVQGITAGTATITYTVKGEGPCSDDQAKITISVAKAPEAGVLNGDESLCGGEVTTLKSSGDAGGTWRSSDEFLATVDASGVVTALRGGDVWIQYTVPGPSGCREDYATMKITITALPFPGMIFGPEAICVDQIAEQRNRGDLGGVWSSDNEIVAEVDPNTGIVTGKSGGVAYIRYTVTNTCGTDYSERMITITPKANAGAITGPTSVCIAQKILLTSDGDIKGLWSSSNTLRATVDAESGQVIGMAAGPVTISYKVVGINGCSDATATFDIKVDPLPEPPDNISGPGQYPVCEGTVQTYSVPNVAGITYTWSFGPGWEIKSGQGTNSVTVVVGQSNTITVTPSNSCGSGKPTSRTIKISPLPTITGYFIDGVNSIDHKVAITYGCASPVLKVTVTNGTFFTWYKCNSDGTGKVPVSKLLDLLKDNYRVPPANGYYDEDYGDQKGIGAGTHYYVVGIKNGCGNSYSEVFEVVVKPAKALGDYDAKSYYTGPKFVWTTTTTSNTATATLSAFLRNSEEGNCGDIATARVTFEYRSSSGDWTRVPNGTNLPVSYVDPRDPTKGGTAAVIAQLSIPQNQNSENYDIRVLIGGNYYNGPPSEAVSICQLIVGKVVQGGSIAGGAHLPNLSSTGYVQGIPSSYLCFGVEYVQKGKSITSPKGRVTLRIFSKYDRTGRPTSDLHIYVVRSNAIAGLSITGNKATFTAKSNIAEEIPDLAYPGGIRVEPIEGNCVMTMTVEDWCSTLLSNVLDKVGITIQRNAGGLWYSNNWIKSKTEPACIFGGDILVIAPTSVPVKSGTGDMNSLDATASFAEFNVKVFGNPSSSSFNVLVSGSNDKVAMRIVDVNGRLLETRIFAGNSTIQFGSGLRPGTYFAQFIQGDNRKTVTLIKNIR